MTLAGKVVNAVLKGLSRNDLVVARHTALHAVGASVPECSLRVGHPD
jgi:hypothetical protein